MKKTLLLLASLLLIAPCSSLDVKIIDTSSMPFVPHLGPGAFDNALALNVPYHALKELRAKIEKQTGLTLEYYKGWAQEGEAHVTVITPVEYWEVLRPYISIDEINNIATTHKIQETSLLILGIGRGKSVFKGKEEQTFFIIAASSRLKVLRQAVWKEFVKKGGNPEAFNPNDFYPHITIGYTLRDLHIQDGVYKDVVHTYDSTLSKLIK